MADEILDPVPRIQTTNRETFLRMYTRDNAEGSRRERHILVSHFSQDKLTRLASENTEEFARMAELMIRLAGLTLERPPTIAFIGCGFAIAPRLANLRSWDRFDIFEKEIEITRKMTQLFPDHAAKWNFIIGNYRDMLSSTYSVIFYDLQRDLDDAPDDLAFLEGQTANLIY